MQEYTLPVGVLRFQFLIGRLDTDYAVLDALPDYKFQFLIGRLDTLRSLSITDSGLFGFNSS